MQLKNYRLNIAAGLIAITLMAGFGFTGLLSSLSDSAQPSAAMSFRPTTVHAAPNSSLGAGTQATPNCAELMQPFTTAMISSTIPEDAYSSLQCPDLKPPPDLATRLKLQRIYDTFSWQSFLALNWPIALTCDAQGCQTSVKPENPDRDFTPQWAAWKEGYEIFKIDGSAPSPWDAPRTLPTELDTRPLAGYPDATDKNIRILFQTHQANSNQPLWDQNGNRVYYEVLINEQEFNFIDSNELYHLQGQINYFQKNVLHRQEVVVFIPGSLGDIIGVIELKLAWKILTSDDIAERYYTMNAYVYNPEQARWEEQRVGLVGMHIAHKTLSSTEWVWSTFAHVDNVRVNDMDTLNYLEANKTLKPSFTNPYTDNLTLPVNVLPEPDAAGVRRTQVLQVIPIAQATAALNQQVQELLRAQNSVWQYYELVGTQYSTDPSAPPASPLTALPTNITNRSGGMPAPVYLVNPVIETYDQEGNQEASDLAQGPLNDAKHTVFGTQSCMGCHFSAGIASRYVDNMVDNQEQKEPIFEPETADFSFLLERAHWQKSP